MHHIKNSEDFLCFSHGKIGQLRVALKKLWFFFNEENLILQSILLIPNVQHANSGGLLIFQVEKLGDLGERWREKNK